MVKSAELLQQRLISYRRDPTGQVFVRTEMGEDLLVECDRCGDSENWLVPPGPKEGLTLICNSCITTYVFILHQQD